MDMKTTKTLLVVALAAAALAAGAAQAQSHSGRGSSGVSASGSHGGASGSRHSGTWSGRGAAVGGHYRGGGGHWGGGGRYWGGSRYWGPSLGLYFGAPLLYGAYYWGSPYWDDYYYPRSTMVYRERVIEPYPEGEVSSTEIAPRSPGAPTQAPTYRNYCDSAKAYYPKVTSCPEGWRFEPSR
jgi:hypothetical protein